PATGGPWLIDSFVSTARHFADWMVADDALPIRVWAIAEHAKTGAGRIGFAAGGVEGEIVLSMAPGGWVLAVASIGGAEVFRGYVDRQWEQCDIWPVGATPARDDEGPGRI